jgi:hypothetical protein
MLRGTFAAKMQTMDLARVPSDAILRGWVILLDVRYVAIPPVPWQLKASIK